MLARDNERIELGELLADVVADAAPETAQAGCRVELDVGAFAAGNPGVVCGDAEMLHRVFDNLLRNALTHAAQGGWVGIEVSVAAGEIRVRVEDRGPGVPGDDLARLFEPFYRGPQLAARIGHGLGLAIARRAAERLGGSLVLSNHAQGGLLASLLLPLE